MGIRLNKSKVHDQARRALAHPERIDNITIDGKAATVDEAKAALAEETKLDEGEVGAFAQKLDEFEKKVEDAKLGIPGTPVQAKIGKWSLSALELAPDESIKETKELSILLKTGKRITVQAESIDLQSSAFMKRISSLVNGGSAIPFFVGTVIGYGAGAISAVAAVGAHALGKKQVGAALIRMATKHLILSTVTNLPVAGNAACLLCAARDERDRQKLTAASEAATVENTVDLAKHGPARLPADDVQ